MLQYVLLPSTPHPRWIRQSLSKQTASWSMAWKKRSRCYSASNYSIAKRCLSVDCAMSNGLTWITEEKLYMTFILMLSLLYPTAFYYNLAQLFRMISQQYEGNIFIQPSERHLRYKLISWTLISLSPQNKT